MESLASGIVVVVGWGVGAGVDWGLTGVGIGGTGVVVVVGGAVVEARVVVIVVNEKGARVVFVMVVDVEEGAGGEVKVGGR